MLDLFVDSIKPNSFYSKIRCLDGWRAVSPNPQSFYECDICKFQYRIQNIELEPEDPSRMRWRKFKFGLLMTRDLLGVLVLLNVVRIE